MHFAGGFYRLPKKSSPFHVKPDTFAVETWPIEQPIDYPKNAATFEHVREGRGMAAIDADVDAYMEANHVN